MLAMSMVYILLQKVLLRAGWFGGDKSRVPLLQFILTSGAQRIILKSINKKVTSLALAEAELLYLQDPTSVHNSIHQVGFIY